MSQAKVDRNKEQKANRKQIMAREKRQHFAAVACIWAILIAIAGWAGYSAYGIYQNNQPIEKIYVNLDAIDEYTATLNGVE
ncbi:MAG: hypothetical protein ACI4DR_03920 [Roseburia sp.]